MAITAFAVSPCYAQTRPKVEIGTTLASGMFGVGEENNDSALIGIPSAGLGMFSQGIYTSVFLGSHFAIEPQVAFMWMSSLGDSGHIFNFTTQANYFVSGKGRPSVYLFGTAGVIEISDTDVTPASFGVGGGYRIPVGDRLVFRLDGRYTYVSDNTGQVVSVGLAIGGVF
jgi:hypothetical protein